MTTCPYLKEVVMLFCEATCVRKGIPLDRIATGQPCIGDFHDCPFFREVMTRLSVTDRDRAPAELAAMAGKDGRQ
jgi:hypothetical protein